MEEFSTTKTMMMLPTFEEMVTLPFGSLLLPAWVVVVAVAVSALLWWFLRFPGRRVTDIRAIRASKFSPEMVPKNIDTVVIGSGSGGCACANLLAQSGQRVLLLEQHPDRTGGCTHIFEKKGASGILVCTTLLLP